MPWRPVIWRSLPSGPGSSMETRRHAPINFSFSPDWARARPPSAAAAKTQQSSVFISRASASGHGFEFFGIARALHGDLRGGYFDVVQVGGSKFHRQGRDIFVEAMQFG